jgi:tetratricopeptide (TPR) repeat protein
VKKKLSVRRTVSKLKALAKEPARQTFMKLNSLAANSRKTITRLRSLASRPDLTLQRLKVISQRNAMATRIVLVSGLSLILLVGIRQAILAYQGTTNLRTGEDALDNGRTQEAVAKLTEAIGSGGTAGQRAYFYRAIAFDRLGDSENALKDYGEFLAQHPKSAEALLARACEYVKLQEYESAIADCDAALVDEPHLYDAVLVRAFCLAQAGQFAAALDDCATYQSVTGENASNEDRLRCISIIALAHSKLGHHSEAIDAYASAINLNRDEGRLYQERAELYAATSKWNQALADVNTALQFGGGVRAFSTRALCYEKLGDLRHAHQDLTTAVALDPKDISLLRRRAEIALALRKYASASTDLRKVLDAEPGNTRIAKAYEESCKHLPPTR